MTKLIVSIALSIAVAGGGVGIIAQDAKPGDMLYGFKTSVNEKIAGLFVTSYTAEVDYEVSLLEERLKEIDALVSAGKMSGEEALLAKTAVVAQLEKTQAAIANGNNKNLTDAEKTRISASLSRLQVVLTTYKDSLNTLDAAVEVAVAEKPTLKRHNNSKSVVTIIAEAADAIQESTEDILEEIIDIAEDFEDVIAGTDDMGTTTDEFVEETEEDESSEEEIDDSSSEENEEGEIEGDMESETETDSEDSVEIYLESETTVDTNQI